MPYYGPPPASATLGSYLYIDDAQPIEAGYVEANGQAISRVTYSAYFALVGVKYGAGDGVNTFNVPDMQGRAVIGRGTGSGLSPRSSGQEGGEEAHILTSPAEIPSHGHSNAAPNTALQSAGGGSAFAGGANNTGTVNLNNTGSGGSHNTMMPWTCGGMWLVRVL